MTPHHPRLRDGFGDPDHPFRNANVMGRALPRLRDGFGDPAHRFRNANVMASVMGVGA
jgi:hypothetical protein